MASAVVPVALLVVVVNAVTGAVGAYLWWRVEDPTRAFGRLVRAGQALAGVLAVTSGVAALVDEPPDDGLFWVYALLPVAVSFVAEQLRVASAASELDARGLPDAQAMRTLPEREQRGIVLSILRREMGVMTCAALVVAFLALRAAGTV